MAPRRRAVGDVGTRLRVGHLRYQGTARRADPQLRESITILCLLMAAQGAVGLVQYETKLPTEMVWVHVSLATVTWLAVLWAVAAAGRLAPRAVEVPAGAKAQSRGLELVGRAN